MNLTRLRYFVTVADELHFGRAAERLHMAQPPLSQQIKQLEAELDVQLFTRTTRQVSLTEAGRRLYPAAQRTLDAAAEAEAVVEAVKEGQTGVLRIGFVDSASYDVMPRFLRTHRERYPNVEVELRTLSSDQQHAALLQREIDLGFGRVPRPGAALAAIPFREERLVLAVPTGDPLAEETSVALAEIRDRPLIGFDREVSPSLFRDLAALLAAEDIAYDPVIETTEYATVLPLVASGLGLAVVPESVRSFQPPGLAFIDLADAAASTSFVLLHREHERSVLIDHAADLVLELFDDR